MLGRVSKQAKQARSTKTKVVVDLQTPAATKIQCMMRRFVARARIRRQARKVWQRVYDPTYKKYFWFNNMDELSRWDLPQFAQLFHLEDHTACTKIEKVVRGFVARMRVRKKVNEKYTRFYDSDLNKFYWLDKSTGETTWTVTNWLRKQEIEMPPEDRMLYQSQQRILELEAMLKDKDREIRDVRKKRFEELEPEMMRDKVKSAKSLSRSKNMDEWKIEDLAAWFTELKLDEYVPFLFQNKVDGLLFLNLAEEEWPDMGITNRFHARKLQIITKAYRMRYQRKRDKVEDEEDELLSEVSPSELSAMIHAEDAADDDYSDSEEDEVGV
ncbi:hypothetical protein B484DRAFT_17921 [Ochromonadaceae sp. CCMP2298]|nr:hypothetical protein B484DRAFT_17921 [Ochromonadaceae sp. CCMP2298]